MHFSDIVSLFVQAVTCLTISSQRLALASTNVWLSKLFHAFLKNSCVFVCDKLLTKTK